MSLHPHLPWYKVPFFSRRKFSPRLLMAWLTWGYIIRVIECWLKTEPVVLNNILVPPHDVLPIVVALVGLVGGLLALGTVQTTVLGDLAPAPGAGNTPASPTPAADEYEEARASEAN